MPVLRVPTIMFAEHNRELVFTHINSAQFRSLTPTIDGPYPAHYRHDDMGGVSVRLHIYTEQECVEYLDYCKRGFPLTTQFVSVSKAVYVVLEVFAHNLWSMSDAE